MDAITISRVSKTFREGGRETKALQEVSLRIRKGEVFGLLGPNGAGKTTLLYIITGLLLPDRGDVRVLGIPSHKRDFLERINFVSGETQFHWALHGSDILEFYGRVYRIPQPERGKRIAGLVEFFGLQETIHKRFTHLSTGERMRLILAKGLLNNPELLILDEPTIGLDPDMAIRMRREISRLNRERGITLLLTSHYMAEVEQLADRVAFINHGRIVDAGTVSQVKHRLFPDYEVAVTVDGKASPAFLEKHGFRLAGGKLHKDIPAKKDLKEIVALLAAEGLRIRNIEIRRPTLEDYFVKVLEED